MYLSKLNLKQKKAFLDACIKISGADGSVAKGEAKIIEEFCNEMNVKFRMEAEKNFDEAIVELNTVSNSLQRKELLFELARVVYADNVIKPREEQLLKFTMDVFKIPTSDYQTIITLVKSLAKVNRDIEAYINK